MRARRVCLTAMAVAAGMPAVCLAQQRPEGATSDSAQARAVAVGIVAADNARDLRAVLSLYAPDAVLLPPGAPPVVGVDSIRPRYEALFAMYDPAIEVTIDEIVVRGDLAYVRGRNGGVLRGRGGAADRPLSDVWVMILRRQPQEPWRITRLVWHGSSS